MRVIGFALILAWVSVCSCTADIITLKTERVLSGVITEQNEKLIKIDLGGGVPVTYYRDQIESIKPTSLESAFDTPNVFTEPKLFLWEVKTPKSTVYLFGSIHLGKEDMYPLAKPVENAFMQADTLVLEVNIDAADPVILQDKISEMALYTDGDKLVNHLSQNVIQKLQSYLMARGILIDQFMAYKPWYVALALTKMQINALGFSAEWGVDKYFANKAKAQAKQILELESVDAQLDFLANIPNQELFLEYSINSLSETESMLSEIFSSWKKGDAAHLEDILITQMLEESPDMKPVVQMILNDRNVPMVKEIERFLSGEGTFFVVVGAAHLIGAEGIVELLKKDGYPVVQQ